MLVDSGASSSGAVVTGVLKPAKSRLGPWSAVDALIAALTVIAGPLLIAFTFYGLGRIGLIPARLGNVFVSSDPVSSLVQYATALFIEIGLIFWLLKHRKAKPGDLGLRRFHPGWLGAVAGLYVIQVVVVIIVFAALQALSPKANLDEVQEVLEFGTTHWAVIGSAISAVLIAPVLEEIIFRGIIFVGLSRVWRPWIAALLSAALFGWLHGQLNVGIYTFVFGLLLTWLYSRSRSLVPGILLHMINNAVAFWFLAGPKG